MNKWYIGYCAAILLISFTSVAQSTQPVPPTEPAPASDTKVIIIEEKVDRHGNKTVTKTVREGNFTDAEIEQIIQEESKGSVNQTPFAAAQPGEEKGYLGVMIENVEGGVRITEVVAESPAEAAGLKTGDVISAIDADPVTNMESLVAAVSSHKPGDAVQVHYLRETEKAVVTATLAKREEPVVSDVFGWDEHIQEMKEHEKEMKEHEAEMKQHEKEMMEHEKMMKEHKAERKEKSRPRFGVTIDDVEEGPGVVVTSVYEGSLADQQGLQEGDIITTFNGVETNSPDDLIEAVQSAPADDKVKVTYLREGKKMKSKVTFPGT